jgi:hypothetical protein
MNSYNHNNHNNQNNQNNQRTYNNNLLNQFNSHLNQPRQNSFMNNPMISQNPNYSSRDPNFYNKIQMAKIEQIKRAKNISDLGMDNKQLSEYIIDPIKINKTSKDEIQNKLHDIESNYIVPVTRNTKFEDQSNAYLRELWKNRTNQPYKNVIKKEMFDKEYKKYYKDDIFKRDINSRNELIVHKVIKNVDADEDLLEAEFLLIQEILEKHNGELKNIYSSSNENKYKKEFEYAQKYRYRLDYNPKDSEELKDFYKKEQKKINKENKMLDQLIDMLVEGEDLSKEESDKINEQLQESRKKKPKVKDLEDELREELGDDFEDIIDAIELDKSKNDVSKKVRIKTSSKIENTVKIPRKKIHVKTSIIQNIEKESNNTEIDELKDFYKNRNKK